MALTLEKKIISQEIVITVIGQIDEDSNLDTLDVNGIKKITFNFEKLTLINSCGIRDWVNWIKKIPSSLEIIYNHCPSFFIDQINMINGLIPEGGIVESFFVPYYCEDKDEIFYKLYTRGKDYTKIENSIPEEISCSECPEKAEIDIIPEKFFKFLKFAG